MIWEDYYSDQKKYSEYHKIEYPPNSKKWYIFNPYAFGTGMWHVMSPTGKAAKTVERSKQAELNKFFFGRAELPSMYERFMASSKEDREKLKEISLGWLQLKLKSLRQGGIQVPKVVSAESREFAVGRMYFYVYDAKLKEVLPKWDALPLTIILDIYEDGFLGLNLHYLDMNKRLIFLSELLNDHKKYDRGDDVLSVTYRYKNLKESINFKEHSVCVKRYLKSHIKSKILPIESHEWPYAAALPVQQWKIKNVAAKPIRNTKKNV